MEFDPVTILWILVGILSIIGSLLIIWTLVPIFFHLFLSPRLDGTYKYSAKDFKAGGRAPIKKLLSCQQNAYQFHFDETSSEYQIGFGDDRRLTYGGIRLQCRGEWYSTQPKEGEMQINLTQLLPPKDIPHSIDSLTGESQRVTAEWLIEGTSLSVVTHFDLYKNCRMSVLEPDLHDKSQEIEDLNFIIFSLEFPEGLPDCSTGKFELLATEFPALINDSPNLRMLTFSEYIMAPPSRKAEFTSAPRLFFDDDRNTFLICAVNEFMLHFSSLEQNRIACGLNGEIDQIVPGYTSSTMLLFDRGINRTFERLGDILRCIHHKERKSMYADIALSYIGYWTDNGSYYYYNPIKGKTLSETLVAVNQHLDDIKLPIKYFNLDSWWYQKSVSAFARRLMGNYGRIIGGGLYGGALGYDIDPYYMHVDVDELSRILGKPFVAHHRWFHADTKYREKHTFYIERNEQNFWSKCVRGFDDKGICFDMALWDELMADCERWNIKVWEQDWLHPQFKALKILRSQIGNAEAWLINMGDAAKKHNVTIQYALSSPGINLTTIKIDAVTFARTTQDYNPRWPRSYDFKPSVQTSILAYALRLWPFTDVFRSTCEGLINGEKMPEFMTLVSTLSCGPVGIGDRIGCIGKDAVMRSCRKDGLILKPDKPLTAVESMFTPNAKYFISSTFSRIGGRRWDYVLINQLNFLPPKDRTVTKGDLGIKEDRIAYHYFKEDFHLLTDSHPFQNRLKRDRFDYWIAAPILKDGLAIIGDISNYVTMSFREVIGFDADEDTILITLEGVEGDIVQLLMYDENVIEGIQVGGIGIHKIKKHIYESNFPPEEEAAWYWDERNHASLLVLKFPCDGYKEIEISI